MAVRTLIPKKGRGTSKASNASDGMVCTTPAKPRITWPITPPRLATMPNGIPTMIESSNENPANWRCRSVQRASLCGKESFSALGERALCPKYKSAALRSEEHTSELQSHSDLVCRLLLEKKK